MSRHINGNGPRPCEFRPCSRCGGPRTLIGRELRCRVCRNAQKRQASRTPRAKRQMIEWRHKNPLKVKASKDRYWARLRIDPVRYSTLKEKQNARLASMRRQAIIAYGGKCTCCGESEFLFLTFEHSDRSGKQDRASRTIWRFYKRLLIEHPSNIEVQCFNCNLSRGFFGYCPHEKRASS